MRLEGVSDKIKNQKLKIKMADKNAKIVWVIGILSFEFV